DLGLSELTIEAWVRRDGAGRAAGTGVGGLSLVPIAGKGRGESDGSNLDCNYAFGFSNDVLGADFEDMATGANHPIVGHTAIPIGEWHHVAASYDGTTWRLFVDGRLDAQRRANATPRHDSIQHFGIGAAFNSQGVAAGRLHGAIDELRVWDRARDAEEIASTMFQTLESGEGLRGRWALDASDAGAPDTLGANDGTVEGDAMFVEPGAVLDRGLPPIASGASPEDGASVDEDSVELSVDVEDPDGTEGFVATFYARELTEADDFSVVVLPDTQIYTIEARGVERFFYDQTQWIMDNREDYGIVGVIHNGDLVNDGERYQYEWRVADRAMSTLEEAIDALLDGMPYGIAPGNHDQTPRGTAGNTTSFNAYFGVDRFRGRAYYGGHYGSANDDSWFTFTVSGGLQFVVVNLQYDETPDPAVLAWARQIFESHPQAFGILNTHYLIGGTARFGAQGRAIYDALKDVDNVQVMTCGHVSSESRRTDTFEGNVIHTMLADYQGRTNGGNGFMRIWEFSPANDELTVRSYSPTLDRFETDENSEFTLPVDLSGAGGPFAAIGSVAFDGAVASVTFDGLEAGHVYEWYATVSDCTHTTSTPVHRLSR
ncbi:MAG: LamG-like jellyroll fold domain-containing protein, partial [Sandaracinaceae bacterium]